MTGNTLIFKCWSLKYPESWLQTNSNKRMLQSCCGKSLTEMPFLQLLRREERTSLFPHRVNRMLPKRVIWAGCWAIYLGIRVIRSKDDSYWQLKEINIYWALTGYPSLFKAQAMSKAERVPPHSGGTVDLSVTRDGGGANVVCEEWKH